MMKQMAANKKTSVAYIELNSNKRSDGTVDYWLKTTDSTGEVNLEKYSSPDGANHRMRRYLSASSQFRSDLHKSIKISIEKEFLL